MRDRLFIAWQDASTRSWHTVARVVRDDDGYEFVFTKGATQLGSFPFDLFNMKLGARYRFDSLIPFLSNKVPSRSRDDYRKMAHWFNLTGDEDDEFELLLRFGLVPGGDSFLVYPEPLVKDGSYELEFFLHGLRHRLAQAEEWCGRAKEGDELLPMLDIKNSFDRSAVALRDEPAKLIIGYVPAFYSHDFSELLRNREIAKRAVVCVIRCNADAPLQLRLLCRYRSPVPEGFRSLQSEEHQPLLTNELAAV